MLVRLGVTLLVETRTFTLLSVEIDDKGVVAINRLGGPVAISREHVGWKVAIELPCNTVAVIDETRLIPSRLGLRSFRGPYGRIETFRLGATPDDDLRRSHQLISSQRAGSTYIILIHVDTGPLLNNV